MFMGFYGEFLGVYEGFMVGIEGFMGNLWGSMMDDRCLWGFYGGLWGVCERRVYGKLGHRHSINPFL